MKKGRWFRVMQRLFGRGPRARRRGTGMRRAPDAERAALAKNAPWGLYDPQMRGLR